MAESDKDWYEYLALLTCISVGHISNCYDSFIDIDNILGSMAYQEYQDYQEKDDGHFHLFSLLSYVRTVLS